MGWRYHTPARPLVYKSKTNIQVVVFMPTDYGFDNAKTQAPNLMASLSQFLDKTSARHGTPDYSDFLYEPDQPVPPCIGPMRVRAAELFKITQEAPDMSIDASVSVWTSGDLYSAWCVAFPPANDGDALTADTIRRALASAKLGFGVDEARVEAMAQNQSYMRLALIASGERAQHGEDGKVVDMTLERAEDAPPPEDDYGRIDFKNLNWIQNVTKGQKLCRIIPPTSGQDGMNVLGQRQYAKPGRAAPYVAGDHTAFSEDGVYLLAAIDGQLLRKGTRYVVDETLTIKGNVDYSTGNIKCNGSVVVMGDVYPNFEVEAQNNITVYGTVDGGTLKAGKDVAVFGGVLASNQGYIHAGGNFRCRFMEYGKAYVGQNAYFENLIHSNINCEGDIFVTSGRGTVIGGRLVSMGNITINTCGNRANCNTILHLDCTEEFTERKRTLAIELGMQSERCARIEERLETFRQEAVDIPADKLRQIEMSLSMERIKMQRLQNAMNEMQQQQDQVLHNRIMLTRFYPNVVIKMLTASMRVELEDRATAFYFRDDKIVAVPH